MQKFHYQLDTQERRIVRRWHLATFGLYGSILLGLILYVAFSAKEDVNYASANPAAPVLAVSRVQH